MTHKVLSDTPYETEYVETDELDWGTQQQKQSPYTTVASMPQVI